jgi:hypothetical protein
MMGLLYSLVPVRRISCLSEPSGGGYVQVPVGLLETGCLSESVEIDTHIALCVLSVSHTLNLNFYA